MNINRNVLLGKRIDFLSPLQFYLKLVLFFMIYLFSIPDSIGQNTFFKSYGLTNSREHGRDIAPINNDSAFVLFGKYQQPGSYYPIVAKTDNQGNISWAKEFLLSSNVLTNKIDIIEDSMALISSTIEDTVLIFGTIPVQRYGILHIMIDRNGDTLWTHKLYSGDTSSVYYFSAGSAKTNGDTLIIPAGKTGNDVLSGVMFLDKFTGQFLGLKGIALSTFNCIGIPNSLLFNDYLYLLVEGLDSFCYGTQKIYIIKTDLSGNPVGAFAIDDTVAGSDYFIKGDQLTGGLFLCYHTFKEPNENAGDLQLVFIDSSFTEKRSAAWVDANTNIIDVNQLGNGDFLITGWRFNFTVDHQFQFSPLYTAPVAVQGQTLTGIWITDSNYIFTGTCKPAVTVNDYQGILYSTDLQGVGCNYQTGSISMVLDTTPIQTLSASTFTINNIVRESVPITINNYSLPENYLCITGLNELEARPNDSYIVSPNPFINEFTISGDVPVKEVIIYSVLGEIIFSRNFSNDQSTEIAINSDELKLLPNVYLLKIIDQHFSIFTYRLIKL